MKIRGKTVKTKTNISKEKCPVCGKNLRAKSPCCGQPEAFLMCVCGYKEVINVT